MNPDAVILNRGLQYLNPAAFQTVHASPVSGEQIRAGSEGWGAQTPGLWNVDFTLGKNFEILGHAQRAQSSNQRDLRTTDRNNKSQGNSVPLETVVLTC